MYHPRVSGALHPKQQQPAGEIQHCTALTKWFQYINTVLRSVISFWGTLIGGESLLYCLVLVTVNWKWLVPGHQANRGVREVAEGHGFPGAWLHRPPQVCSRCQLSLCQQEVQRCHRSSTQAHDIQDAQHSESMRALRLLSFEFTALFLSL